MPSRFKEGCGGSTDERFIIDVGYLALNIEKVGLAHFVFICRPSYVLAGESA
jgi:hypothetical protein